MKGLRELWELCNPPSPEAKCPDQAHASFHELPIASSRSPVAEDDQEQWTTDAGKALVAEHTDTESIPRGHLLPSLPPRSAACSLPSTPGGSRHSYEPVSGTSSSSADAWPWWPHQGKELCKATRLCKGSSGPALPPGRAVPALPAASQRPSVP